MSIPSTVLRGADLYHDRHFAIGVKTLLQNVGSGASITDSSPLGLTITKVGTVSQITSGARFGMPGFNFPDPPGSTAHYVRTAYDSALKVLGGAWTMEARFTLNALPGSPGGGGGLPWGSLVMGLCGTTYGSWNSSTGPHLLLIVSSTGQLQLHWRTSTASASANYPTLLTTSTEYYVRCTHDGSSTLTIEVNGSASTFSVSAGSMVSPSNNPCVRCGTHNDDNNSDQYYLALRGTVWGVRLTAGVVRPLLLAHRSMPFPVNPGVANVYVPGDGSGGPPAGGDPTAPKGQHVVTSPGTWTVPEGVDKISIVCVGMRAKIGGVTVVQAQAGAMVGDHVGEGGGGGTGETYYELLPNPDQGGGGGGAFGGGGAPYIWVSYTHDGGGGGAGGYGANGGNGGDTSDRPLGAGKGGRNGDYYNPSAVNGQGVSLLGITPGGGTLYGGGPATSGQPTGSAGHALASKNAVAVTSGVTVTFENATGAGSGTRAARVMWGGGRSYPYAAHDV